MTNARRANIEALFYLEVEHVLDGNDPDTRRLSALLKSSGEALRRLASRFEGQNLSRVYGPRGTDAARAVLAGLHEEKAQAAFRFAQAMRAWREAHTTKVGGEPNL